MKAFPELTAALGEMFRAQALGAMSDFVGDKRSLLTSIELICRDLGQ